LQCKFSLITCWNSHCFNISLISNLLTGVMLKKFVLQCPLFNQGSSGDWDILGERQGLLCVDVFWVSDKNKQSCITGLVTISDLNCFFHVIFVPCSSTFLTIFFLWSLTHFSIINPSCPRKWSLLQASHATAILLSLEKFKKN